MLIISGGYDPMVTPDDEPIVVNELAGEWGEGRAWHGPWPSTLLPPAQYHDPERLTEDAIVLYESGGDPDAANPRSSARGLLQILDVLARDYGLDDSDELLGRPELSRSLFRRHMDRTRGTHNGDPAVMSLVWNHGGGGARQILRIAERHGIGLPDATRRYVYAREKQRGATDGAAQLAAQRATRYVASVLVRRRQLRARLVGPTGRPAPPPDDSGEMIL